MIPAQCEGIVMARPESPLGVTNGLVEPNPEGRPPEGLYIARTVVRDRREVPVRVLNATRSKQKLTKGSPLAHCEPVTLVTPPDVEEAQVRNTIPKLQNVIEAAKANLSDAEVRELEGLLTEYGNIFAMDSDDYGRTDRVCHRRYGRGLTDSPTPEEAPSSITCGYGRDARGHART
jgi:hypothetical protein